MAAAAEKEKKSAVARSLSKFKFWAGIGILNFLSKKFVKLNGDLHYLAEKESKETFTIFFAIFF